MPPDTLNYNGRGVQNQNNANPNGGRQAPSSGAAVADESSRPFILRPVATSLLMVAILLAGWVAYLQLPVSALPQVDYPTIQVMTFIPAQPGGDGLVGDWLRSSGSSDRFRG